MANILKILVLLNFFIASFAYAGTGPATQYEITMTKIELCEDGSTVANCKNPITISPSSDSGLVDIAAVDAGTAAASYGNLKRAKQGTVYSYMQITMKRAMKITGTAGNSCTTVRDSNGSLSANAVGQSGGTPGSALLYVGTDSSGSNTQYNGADNSDGSGASADGVIASDDTYFQYRQLITGSLIIVDKSCFRCFECSRKWSC